MAETRINTSGTRLWYGVEETAGTRPAAASAYTEVEEVKEIPSFDDDTPTLDATPLSAKNRIYIDDIPDTGGLVEFTANFSQAQLTRWNTTIINAYKDAVEAGKAMWFCITIPGFTDAFYMQGKPLPIRMPAATVGSVYECTLKIVPTGDMDWYAKPTGVGDTVLGG